MKYGSELQSLVCEMIISEREKNKRTPTHLDQCDNSGFYCGILPPFLVRLVQHYKPACWVTTDRPWQPSGVCLGTWQSEARHMTLLSANTECIVWSQQNTEHSNTTHYITAPPNDVKKEEESSLCGTLNQLVKKFNCIIDSCIIA